MNYKCKKIDLSYPPHFSINRAWNAEYEINHLIFDQFLLIFNSKYWSWFSSTPAQGPNKFSDLTKKYN